MRSAALPQQWLEGAHGFAGVNSFAYMGLRYRCSAHWYHTYSHSLAAGRQWILALSGPLG